MRKYLAFLLFTIFASATSIPAEGRFLKTAFSKHKKHAKKKKHRQQNTTIAESNTPPEETLETTVVQQKSKSQLKKEKKGNKRKEKAERKLLAQKEKEERKQKRKNKNKSTTVSPQPVQPVIKKWADIEYPESVRKTHYRIDILAAMYLDDLVRNGYAVKDIPQKAVEGLNFYKGIQIASDTLKKAGFDIDIYVHDVATLLESTEMLVRKNALDSSDLIIGAVSDKDVATLAAYAKKMKVNFISVASSNDAGVTDNQFFTILQPSLKSHMEWQFNKMEQDSKSTPLMLCRTINNTDAITNGYIADLTKGKITLNKVICNSLPQKADLARYVDSTMPITLFVPITDIKYADTLLKTVSGYFPDVHFNVYGMPSWTGTAALTTKGALNRCSIYTTQAPEVNSVSAGALYVDKTYKKEYGGKPQAGVYKGYEVLFWYANLLKRYGTIFNKQYADNETAPFTRFEIKPKWDAAGNVSCHENRYLLINKYEKGTRTVIE